MRGLSSTSGEGLACRVVRTQACIHLAGSDFRCYASAKMPCALRQPLLRARPPTRFGAGWEAAPPDDTRPQCKQVRQALQLE